MNRLCWLLAAVLTGFVGFASAPSSAATIAPVKSCEALAKIDLSGVADRPTHIESAAPAKFQGADVCEVKGFVEPAVNFVVRLPLQNWSGRFLQVGCGGLCGHIPDEYAQTHGCQPFESGGMAVAATDMGHSGRGPEFGDDPQLRIDFALRGVHVTAQISKAIIADFYGQRPAHSYFLGCSDGGREGLMEVQRFPEDFDGVTAGAPALNFLIQNTFYHAWNARANTGPGGKPVLTADDLPILHRAALKACAAEDGVIADALNCKFDPAVVACGSGETKDCLTPAQVETARKIYEGPHDANGLALTPGGPQPGSELAWAGVFVPEAGSDFIFGRVIAGGAIAHLAFAPKSSLSLGLDDLTFDRATYDRLLPQHSIYDATNPQISRFVDRGGKLILWHGASDPHISPFNTIAYYDAVKAAIGDARAQQAVRFFLLPGLYHCEGGEGPVQTDVLSAIIDWVENGKAPQSLIAHGAGGSRPVFPFPALAAYDGMGKRSEASSYTPSAREAPRVRAWIGEALFAASANE